MESICINLIRNMQFDIELLGITSATRQARQ